MSARVDGLHKKGWMFSFLEEDGSTGRPSVRTSIGRKETRTEGEKERITATVTPDT